MSGTGQSNTQAPTRLTPIVLDQPIVDARTGQPTPYFGQMIQRILSYLGQPGSATTTGTTGSSGLTVTEQLNNLSTQIEILQASAAGNTPQSGTIGRLATIENIIRNFLRYQRPPRTATRLIVIPAAPQPAPNLTPAMILSWWNQ
jgi:hypothetical protein